MAGRGLITMALLCGLAGAHDGRARKEASDPIPTHAAGTAALGLGLQAEPGIGGDLDAPSGGADEAVAGTDRGSSAAGLWVLGSMYVRAGATVAQRDVSAPRPLQLRVAPGMQHADWRSIVAEYAWPVGEADAVIECESSGHADAYNDGSYGLMQIEYSAHVGQLVRVTGSSDPTLLYDPAVNIAVGWLVFEESGGGSWAPWSCRP